MHALLIAAALAAAGATTAAPARAEASAADLVDVAVAVPGLRLDLRYATPDNFLRIAVYPCGRCLLRRPAAEALARAQASLAARGLGLLLWDCYRPLSVQRAMWALVPDGRYVADPARGSIHNRGGAVDLTLVDRDGKLLAMPTPFDHFGPEAAAEAPAPAEAAAHRATLRAAMEEAGFTGIRTEWWHFDAPGSRGWPLVDAPLCLAR